MKTRPDLPLVGIVGPCGSGKTTLARRLEPYGIPARHIAQEHSYVPSMWQRITHPDILIFLDASYPETIRRRQLNWTEDEYLEQHHRLAHACQHANLYIFTDTVSPDEIADRVVAYLRTNGYPDL